MFYFFLKKNNQNFVHQNNLIVEGNWFKTFLCKLLKKKKMVKKTLLSFYLKLYKEKASTKIQKIQNKNKSSECSSSKSVYCKLFFPNKAFL